MIETLDEQRCTGCNICFNVCPCDVFRTLPQRRLVEIAYRDDCQTCFLCELDCRKMRSRLAPCESQECRPGRDRLGALPGILRHLWALRLAPGHPTRLLGSEPMALESSNP